ncbi:glutaredoxin [Eubacteriales bacterium OttesenSCG-928-A19]|nr:glutaredoxin [Eubacteriales bacterium OttesenSCG-928-A19]
MKPITMFMMKTCPYCQRAFGWMDELKKENPEYAKLDIKMIDEREEPELCAGYDYYYVPTYYVGEEKVHEGAASREAVQRVFDRACERA